jgi:DNA adenine methylase
MSRKAVAYGLVKVIHGANDGTFAVVGEMVQTVRASLVDAFNIPSDALAFANGEQAERTYRLQPNDTLEFVRQAGEKEGSSFLRYPGGKWNHRKHIIENLKPYLKRGIQYRELFFGGGGIGLQLLQDGLLSSMWINDRDAGIAALWTSVIRYPDELKKLVMRFVPTRKAFGVFKEELLVLNSVPTERKELVSFGFRKLALHQMSYSGLGETGGPLAEIDSRWSQKHICNKVDSIHRDFASVSLHGKACSCHDFERMILGDGSVLYLDPPYYKQGAALYKHALSAQDHARLARLLQDRKSPWLLSYDDCPEIRALYQWALVETVPVNYSITGASKRSELLIRPK